MPREMQASRTRNNMESAGVVLVKWKTMEKYFLNLRKTLGNSSEIRARCGGPLVVLAGRILRPASSRVVCKAERLRLPSRHVAMCNTVAGRRRRFSGVWPGGQRRPRLRCKEEARGAGANFPIPTRYWNPGSTPTVLYPAKICRAATYEERCMLPLPAGVKRCVERLSPEANTPAVCNERTASSLLWWTVLPNKAP